MMENRHHALGLSDEQVLEMYETMLLSRKLDERIMAIKSRRENSVCRFLSRTRSCTSRGCLCFESQRRLCFPYYRDLGVVLTLA